MEFYFYDVETTGMNPIKDRIIQFGGQRLDANLKPKGEVEEFYVKLSDDVLPNASALAVNQITPQMANLEGLTEYQFIRWLNANVYTKGTIYGGYNIDDFDNQFMHWLHWRNFSLPAPMTQSAKSFDIYKLARLAADLRPEGINWQKDDKTQRPKLSLESITQVNKIKNDNRHTSASDTLATVALARLIKTKQVKLFDHFLKLLEAKFVKSIVSSDQPFLYSAYTNLALGSSTTLATVVCEHPTEVDCLIVYDLRQSVEKYKNLNDYDLSLVLSARDKNSAFSVININQVPVVAPISVLDQDSAQRLKLEKNKILKNLSNLRQTDLANTVSKAYLRLSQKQRQPVEVEFANTKISKPDLSSIEKLKQAKPSDLANLDLEFEDGRFKHLLFLYRARNFPKTLGTDQIMAWEKYRHQAFFKGKPSGLDIFNRELRKSLQIYRDDAQKINLLEELQLYIESIMPSSSEQ